MRGVFGGYTAIKLGHLLYLVIKMHTNSTNKVFRIKQAQSKVPLFFVDVKVLGEKFALEKGIGTGCVVSILKTQNEP